MRVWRWLVVFMFSCITMQALEISPVLDYKSLLPDTEIYIDYNRTTTIQTVHKKIFKSVDKESIGFGYSPNIDIWVKIKLHNYADRPLHMILEYSNPLTTHLEFYNGENQSLIGKDGLLQSHPRQTLNPYFELSFEANETKIYYLKASSTITALVLHLDLWKPRVFYEHALQLRSMLSLFFGAMLIIVLYNLIIYFIVRELSYLYYVLFFAFIALHQFNYRGVLSIVLSDNMVHFLVEHATFIVAAPVFFLMLFTKEVLMLKQYKKVYKFYSRLLLLYPIIIVSVHLLDFYTLRAVLSVSMLFILFIITWYAYYKKNRQAKYLIIGWALFWTASLLMYLSNIGVYDIFSRIPFYTEWILVIEALIFAFSLAMMIKQTNKDKLEAQEKYIILQNEKEQYLTLKVKERTRQLSISLQEKDLLLKELNHRVKNSIQIIVSFLRLQIDDTENEKMQRVLIHVENRILSINHLYTLLNTKENILSIDAYEYFRLLIATIEEGFYQENIEILVDTSVQLHSQTAVYCGFILNEALTNALQHAFKDGQKGCIEVTLVAVSDEYIMQIKDNGSGFNIRREFNSLGLDILELLAIFQLQGTLDIDATEGTAITVRWKE